MCVCERRGKRIYCFHWYWILHRGNIIICVPDVLSCLCLAEKLAAVLVDMSAMFCDGSRLVGNRHGGACVR